MEHLLKISRKNLDSEKVKLAREGCDQKNCGWTSVGVFEVLCSLFNFRPTLVLRLGFIANAALSVARVVTYNGSDFRFAILNPSGGERSRLTADTTGCAT